MKLLSDNLKSQILIVAALSLPISVLATWSFSGSKEYTSYGVEIGSANSVSSWSLAVGLGNSTAGSSATVGQYLSSQPYSLVVGKYNQGVGAYFVVGNGTSTSNKKNALEVYSNGRVVIPTPSSVIPSN